MAAERARDGLTGVRDEENRLGWPPIASALENESMRRWRLLGGPVCASLPNSSGSILGQCSASAALSTAQASPEQPLVRAEKFSRWDPTDPGVPMKSGAVVE